MTIINGLLTTYGSLVEVELNYFYAASGLGNTYVAIGKPDQFANDLNPPAATEDQASIKQVFKHVYAAKKVTSANLSAVVPRYDWTSGNIYTAYADYTQNFVFNADGFMTNQFYVRNNVDQVFKCLYSPGTPSTVQPALAPGQTDPKQLLHNSDGYKWIYVTTIDKGLKQKFFDNIWMPISVGLATPNPLTTAKMGSIDAINITNAGNNYTNGVATTTTINIVGDGTGAAAYANVYGNVVSDIVVTSTGNNYTYATVSITPSSGYSGSGATANAVISPIGGHGYDPVSELGCNHIMLSMEFDGTENGNIPGNSTFRQVSVIVDPVETTGATANASIYNTSDIATVSFGTGIFTIGEVVFQSNDGTYNNPYFTAVVSNFDSVNNILSLINITGNYAVGSTINGVSSGASRILLNYVPTIFSVGSGYMMYYENRTPVQRSSNDNQQVRLVLKF
jgi:hypothetical protein